MTDGLFIIASDAKGDYAWESAENEAQAIEVAKEYYEELQEGAAQYFRVDIYTGTGEDGPDTHLDPIWSRVKRLPTDIL